MTTNSLNDWSTTPSSNTDIAGTNIAVGCAPADVGVYMRVAMAQIAYAVQGSGGLIPATWHVGAIIAATGTIGTLAVTTLNVTNISFSGSLSLSALSVSGTSTLGVTSATALTATSFTSGGALSAGTVNTGTLTASSIINTTLASGTGTFSNTVTITQPGTVGNQAVNFSQFPSAGQSFAFPNGVIKGGTATSDVSGLVTINFATAFPSACVSAVANLYGSGPNGFDVYTSTFSASSAVFITTSAGIAAAGVAVAWMAVGR